MKIFLAINIPGYSTIQIQSYSKWKTEKTVLNYSKKIYEILQRWIPPQKIKLVICICWRWEHIFFEIQNHFTPTLPKIYHNLTKQKRFMMMDLFISSRNFGPYYLYKGIEAKLLQSIVTAGFMFLTYEKIMLAIFSLMGQRSINSKS